MNRSSISLAKEHVKQYESLHGGNRNLQVRRFVNHLIKTSNLSGGAGNHGRVKRGYGEKDHGQVKRGQGEKDHGRLKRGQGEKDTRPAVDVGLDDAYAKSRALSNNTKH